MSASRYLLPACVLIAMAAPVAAPQVSTTALEIPPEPPVVATQSGRQTGLATVDRDGRDVIIRSFEPRVVTSGQYRIDIEALDTDGDGALSRAEAAAHATLAAEFNAIDVNRDGRLSRAELAGWIR